MSCFRILFGLESGKALGEVGQENKEVETQPGHLHTGPTIKIAEPSKPTFFQPSEFRTLEALSERIIPQSDTPGAKNAGVALLIDKAIIADPTLGLPTSMLFPSAAMGRNL